MQVRLLSRGPRFKVYINIMNENERINELIDLVSKAQNSDVKKKLLEQLDYEKDRKSSQDDCSGFWFGDIEGTWGRF